MGSSSIQSAKYPQSSTLSGWRLPPIRYDPRDLSEVRVFHQNRSQCRAVSPEHAGRAVTLKDIETARTAYRRSLRAQIRERVARVTDFLPVAEPAPAPNAPARKSKLRTYLEGDLDHAAQRSRDRNLHRHKGASAASMIICIATKPDAGLSRSPTTAQWAGTFS
jgi:hypothetical protein